MINDCYANLYCKDEISLIENYDKAVTDKEVWIIHHRLELTLEGEFAHSKSDLIRLGMYYNRPYFELIFLRKGEHMTLHNKVRTYKPFTEEHKLHLKQHHKGTLGYKHSEETKLKISKALEGRNNPNYGKKPWNKGKKFK